MTRNFIIGCIMFFSYSLFAQDLKTVNLKPYGLPIEIQIPKNSKIKKDGEEVAIFGKEYSTFVQMYYGDGDEKDILYYLKNALTTNEGCKTTLLKKNKYGFFYTEKWDGLPLTYKFYVFKRSKDGKMVFLFQFDPHEVEGKRLPNTQKKRWAENTFNLLTIE